VSKTDLVPLYVDGADPSKPPAFLKTREEIKQLRKLPDPKLRLNGWFVDRGNTFILFRGYHPAELDRERMVAAGCMADAWVQAQSGYAGPMVLQMPTSERRCTA